MSIRNDLLEQILAASGGSPTEEGYYSELIRFSENVTQPGPALDVLANVTLGVGGTDAGGLVTANASGEVTINKAGPYMVKQTFQLEKQSNPGNIEAFFQAEASADGGTTWAPLGSAVNRRVATSNSINVFFDISPVFLPAGLVVRNQWALSSVGGDPADPTAGVADGLLVYTSPSAALLAAGVQTAPSALAVFYTLNGYNYV